MMKDLSPQNQFLDVLVEQEPDGLFLHQQRQYVWDILSVGMSDCKPYPTSIDTQAKVSSDMAWRPSVSDPTTYHSLVGAL
jgi:hypothetical protein